MTNKILTIAFCLLMIITPIASADNWYSEEEGYFTVTDESGNVLFLIGSMVYVGDEYISEGNDRYKVVEVDKDNLRAAATFVEHVEPVVLSKDKSTPFLLRLLSAGKKEQTNNKVGLYCTHSDESYVPTDGTESEPEDGGIFDVSAALEEALKKVGCEVERSETPHEPHDAGAYRRSRQTAVEIMEETRPAILADIHRDAVPPEVYEEEVNGEEVSKVRIVVGASNQNKAANEEFAREIKQIADEKYPGLIKDIYIGKGSYNQDLMPQSILFEMGTHTIEKELVEESTVMLADVMATQMGIDVSKEGDEENAKPAPESNQGDAEGGDTQQPKPEAEQQAQKPAGETSSDSGNWKSILWTLGILTAVGVIVLFIYNSKGNRASEFKSFWREITGIGNRNKR